jgi:ABC-type nitrate/sulfonate/bicarbonate transport system ATPase subunit
VIGRVGAGKSALLSAIAAEMNRVGGQVVLGSGVLKQGFGFVTQDAWIQHATLRDNVLFGKMYNKRKYESVISSCALMEDLKVFAHILWLILPIIICVISNYYTSKV